MRLLPLFLSGALMAALVFASQLQCAASATPTQKSPTGCSSKAPSRVSDEQMESLLTKARTHGAVNIVIKLCLDFVPEGELANDRAVRAQRRTIAQTQNRLLKQLSRYQVKAIKKYQFTPLLAMQVDAAALRFLKGCALVASFEEDQEVPSSP